MLDARRFRRHLLTRMLVAAGLAGAGASACGTAADADDDGRSGTNTGSTSSGTWTRELCFDWPPPASGGAGGVGGAGAGGDVGGAAGAGAAGVGGAGGQGGTSAGVCPSRQDAPPYLASQSPCGGNVIGGPSFDGSVCCYTVQESGCVTGRPYLCEGAATTAEAQWGRDGGWHEHDMPVPSVGELDARLRAVLAQAWCRDGMMEHASIASFGRFALELMAVGAPARLVMGAHRAALDEVRHARACLRLAACYAGQGVAPHAFPFGGGVEVSRDLADIAARAALEGCVGETLAAVHAAEQLAVATDPAVRQVLAVIAQDEARHAELAWATVAWAIQRGGERVRHAVARALEEGMGAAVQHDGGGITADDDPALGRHGRLGAARLIETRKRAVREVVFPCAKLLALDAEQQSRHGTAQELAPSSTV